jgi:hypothetical protein
MLKCLARHYLAMPTGSLLTYWLQYEQTVILDRPDVNVVFIFLW